MKGLLEMLLNDNIAAAPYSGSAISKRISLHCAHRFNCFNTNSFKLYAHHEDPDLPAIVSESLWGLFVQTSGVVNSKFAWTNRFPISSLIFIIRIISNLNNIIAGDLYSIERESLFMHV